jgi:hypothetical protein
MAEGGYYRCDGRDMLAQRYIQRVESKWDRAFNAKKIAVYHTERQFIIRDLRSLPWSPGAARRYLPVV